MRARRGFIVLMLFMLPLGVCAQAVPTSTPNPKLDAQAKAITTQQAQDLFKGIFLAFASQKLTYDMMPADKMPVGEPNYHYAGKGDDGKYHLWVHLEPKDIMAAASAVNWWQSPSAFPWAILFAADSGNAGPFWKSRYDAASNKQDVGLLGQRVLALMHDAAVSKGAEELAIVRRIKVGLSRTTVYSTLKQHGMIAYNGFYNPGEPIGNGNGCRYDRTISQSYWPELNEPYPPSGCPKLGSTRPAVAPKSPSAYVDIETDYNFGCGSKVLVAFDFGDDDRLTKVEESQPNQVCM